MEPRESLPKLGADWGEGGAGAAEALEAAAGAWGIVRRTVVSSPAPGRSSGDLRHERPGADLQ